MKKNKLNLKAISIQSFVTKQSEYSQVWGGSRAGCDQLTGEIDCEGSGGGGTGNPPSLQCPSRVCPTEYCDSVGPNMCLTVQDVCSQPGYC